MRGAARRCCCLLQVAQHSSPLSSRAGGVAVAAAAAGSDGRSDGICRARPWLRDHGTCSCSPPPAWCCQSEAANELCASPTCQNEIALGGRVIGREWDGGLDGSSFTRHGPWAATREPWLGGFASVWFLSDPGSWLLSDSEWHWVLVLGFWRTPTRQPPFWNRPVAFACPIRLLFPAWPPAWALPDPATQIDPEMRTQKTRTKRRKEREKRENPLGAGRQPSRGPKIIGDGKSRFVNPTSLFDVQSRGRRRGASRGNGKSSSSSSSSSSPSWPVGARAALVTSPTLSLSVSICAQK